LLTVHQLVSSDARDSRTRTPISVGWLAVLLEDLKRLRTPSVDSYDICGVLTARIPMLGILLHKSEPAELTEPKKDKLYLSIQTRN
jgi:hypothetical protein